jgi:hypothetical protein
MALTPGQTVGIAGLIGAYGESQAQQAAGINQQTGFMLQARDTLAVAQVRADMSEQYAAIQAGRTLKKAEIEAQNLKTCVLPMPLCVQELLQAVLCWEKGLSKVFSARTWQQPCAMLALPI